MRLANLQADLSKGQDGPLHSHMSFGIGMMEDLGTVKKFVLKKSQVGSLYV